MDGGDRAEMKPPAAGPAEGATAEAALTELRAVNERLLLSGLREQERAAEAGRRADALEHQALHDGLTGLPNRALFHDRLRQAVLTAQRERGTLALLFIDLDRFKAVNDRFGHRAGDLLLRQVGARLRGTLRGSDTAARLGGDEFAVLLPGMVDLPGARRAARRILRALHPPFTIHGLPQEVEASIGVACYPAHGADADTLMRRADAAMYTAKRAAGGVAVAGFDRDQGVPGPPGGEFAAADGSAKPGDEAAEPGLAEVQAVNERLLIAGLREQELADQLRHQLAFTGAVTGSLGEGVYALDRACRVTFVNPAAERLLGWTEADLLGRDARAVVHFPRAAGVPVSGDCPPLEAVRGGATYADDDELFTRRDGTTLPVAYTAAPIVADGEVVGAVVAFRDITERKQVEAARQRASEELERRVRERTTELRATNERLQAELTARRHAEEALRERESRLRLLLEQTPAVIWSTDTALRVTFAAGAALAALGLAPDRIVGLGLRDVAALVGAGEPDRTDAPELMPLPEHRRALAGEPMGYTAVLGGRAFQAYVEPLRDEGGAIAGTIAVAQDITELSLRRLHDEFIATVSHQLLTPLAAARAGLGLLATGVADRLGPDDRRLLDNIGRNIGRLGIHLNDLLALNRLEAGTLPFAPEPLDLRAVATDAMAVVHPLLREKGQALAVALPAPLPVAGDPEELAQAVINLLANAHRHTPPGTRVTLAGRVAGDEVILTVGDSGPGFPAGEREAIFRRFHRLAAPGAAAAPGAGLGLAIVRGIVELHGGRVWAESAPGRGTAFHLALPRAAAGDARGAAPCP